jgi:hypothetical protein
VSTVSWKSEPDAHDYPAAANYLSLLADGPEVEQVVDRLRAAEITHFKAKDILRASDLPLLPKDDPHVAADLKKVHDGRALSPVLLVRGDVRAGLRSQVADGYHRVCASYHVDENTDIPCRITGLG